MDKTKPLHRAHINRFTHRFSQADSHAPISQSMDSSVHFHVSTIGPQLRRHRYWTVPVIHASPKLHIAFTIVIAEGYAHLNMLSNVLHIGGDVSAKPHTFKRPTYRRRCVCKARTSKRLHKSTYAIPPESLNQGIYDTFDA